MPNKRKDRKRDAIARLRAVETILREWDPIGVMSPGWPEDEYDGYAGGLIGLIDRGGSVEAVVLHFTQIREGMGLGPHPERDREYAERIFNALGAADF
jgi:hypothetical protein